MITPVIVHVIFGVFAGFFVLVGLSMLLQGFLLVGDDGARGLGQMFVAILIILIGPLAVRLWCEMIVVLFRINESLTDIRDSILDSKSAQSQFEKVNPDF
jgi:hypothetical protein